MTEIVNVYNSIKEADAILIGASNGLSIAEGYHIFANNEMFRKQFGDFQQRFGIKNVVEGCFHRYPNSTYREEFFKRLIQYWMNDYTPSQVMKDLLNIIEGKDYFVITSNGDTHLELSGFDANRVFEIEGTFKTGFQSIDDKSEKLHKFLTQYRNQKLVILELGIGRYNQLIKRPLMELAIQEPHSTYITFNLKSELYIPEEIKNKSIGVSGDIAQTLHQLSCLFT